ncbi:outer membrane protein assembly factor BamE [Nitrosospira multiformis]|uniref:Outer membrane protein assembly factor BamE n=2 Tax=Nitrosospira multiformis TaxID=1231 RepID=A0A2T5IHR4_9PROT|nr:outer membrane protein assembly factor BamE [Nitrosospira multiformis]
MHPIVKLFAVSYNVKFALETYVAAMRARIITLAVLLLAGCSSVPSLLYKIEIQQGNVITQEMVNKLKPGMTRSQVRFALGSPMISDAFHENRWDYLYRFEQRGKLIEQRKLTIFFEDDHLVRIDGSFTTPVAFLQPQPQPQALEAGTSPESAVSLGEAAMEKSDSSIPAQVPSGMLPLAPPSAPISAPVSGGAETMGTVPALPPLPVSEPPSPAASLSAGSAEVSSSAASETPVVEKPGPRQVPSRATDTGIMDADQPKE